MTAGSGMVKAFNPRPRTGSDVWHKSHSQNKGGFNPRPPHGERRASRIPSVGRQPCFNPRPPHGERHELVVGVNRIERFNPRPPHGERRSPL